MIPSKNAFLNEDFKIEEQPSKTYQMNPLQNLINGHCDNLEAMEQAIYKILNTERYQYPIYSHNYGIELDDLFGEPVTYVCPELDRRITEALTQDERIIRVYNFSFNTEQKRVVKTSFIVHTIFGDVTVEREVNI